MDTRYSCERCGYACDNLQECQFVYYHRATASWVCAVCSYNNDPAYMLRPDGGPERRFLPRFGSDAYRPRFHEDPAFTAYLVLAVLVVALLFYVSIALLVIR